MIGAYEKAVLDAVRRNSILMELIRILRDLSEGLSEDNADITLLADVLRGIGERKTEGLRSAEPVADLIDWQAIARELMEGTSA